MVLDLAGGKDGDFIMKLAAARVLVKTGNGAGVWERPGVGVFVFF